MLGPVSLRSITARIRDDAPVDGASNAVTQLLIARHGRKDFFIFNTDTIRKTVESTTATLTLLIAPLPSFRSSWAASRMNIMFGVGDRTNTRDRIRTAVAHDAATSWQQFRSKRCGVPDGGVLGVVRRWGSALPIPPLHYFP